MYQYPPGEEEHAHQGLRDLGCTIVFYIVCTGTTLGVMWALRAVAHSVARHVGWE